MRVYIRREDRNSDYCDSENCALAKAMNRKLKIRKDQRITVGVGPGRVRVRKDGVFGFGKVVRAFTYNSGSFDSAECVERKLMYPGPGFHLRLKEHKLGTS